MPRTAKPTRVTKGALAPLVARGISKGYGARGVLADVDLVASAGQRIGLVGENGVGKSTLLRILAGRTEPDAGSVERPAELVYLPQLPPFEPKQTVREVLDAALLPTRRVLARMTELTSELDVPESAREYSELLEWAELHDAWDIERRTNMAQNVLGVGALRPEGRIGELSGGERSRLAIATIVSGRPGCLVLDEPTNHLDDDGMGFLEEFLLGLPGVVVAASHDRTFLARISTHIVDLDPSLFGTDGQGGRRYQGNYSAFLEEQRSALARWREAFEAKQDEIAELRGAARISSSAIAPGRGPRDNDKALYNFKGGKVEQTLARRRRNAQRRLESAERERLPKPPEQIHFRLPDGRGPGGHGIALSVRDLVVPGRLQLAALDLGSDGRLLVTGANGSGKSTLFGVLSGRITGYQGTVMRGAGQVRELPQEVVFPDPALTAAKTYRANVPEEGGHPPLRSLGLLHPAAHDTAVEHLSVGQRRRLGLAIIIALGSDVLLLDEPTNHLSLTLVSELEAAFEAIPGALAVATHDRWLRRHWDGPVLELPAH